MDTTVTRRSLVCGLAAGLPLAAVLASPRLARAAADSLQPISLTTAQGRNVNAALAVPDRTPAPAIVLIHEWWGLNDQIKAVAAGLAAAGYLSLAVDLYQGQAAATREEAAKLKDAVDPGAATDTLVSWIGWLNRDSRSTGKTGTLGWCFGGGWSLAASIATPVDATVIYYGSVKEPIERLVSLRGPVLGHFAERDTWITRDMVETFEKNMAAAGRSLTVYWYDADHAFANPTGARYDEADAKLAWERTRAFLKTNLS